MVLNCYTENNDDAEMLLKQQKDSFIVMTEHIVWITNEVATIKPCYHPRNIQLYKEWLSNRFDIFLHRGDLGYIKVPYMKWFLCKQPVN